MHQVGEMSSKLYAFDNFGYCQMVSEELDSTLIRKKFQYMTGEINTFTPSNIMQQGISRQANSRAAILQIPRHL
jgi:hypothetical protein